MKPLITSIPSKTLIGTSIEMSLVNNLTGKLWSTFMPRRGELTNRTNADFISLQVYPDGYFSRDFNPAVTFTKHALVEVDNLNNIPVGMSSFELEGGLYAVFHHVGNDTSIFQEIYMNWLPKSDYQLYNRPHFEVLGEKYKNNNPTSEEDIYIPIKLKSN
jgi:AraC family transcriptional regulator